MASSDEHKPATVYLVIAIILAVLIFLNILLGVVYLLIPKDCFDCQGAAYRRRVAAAAAAEDGGGFYQRARRGPHGYEVARSIYISGSQGQQVTIINGIVEVDDEIDAWAYWATDSEETLHGIPLNNAQPQYQRQSQYEMHNDAAITARTTPTANAMVSDYDYRHSYEQDAPEMQLTSDGIVTMMPNQGDLVLGLAGYDALSPMEAVPERAFTRPPLLVALTSIRHRRIHLRLFAPGEEIAMLLFVPWWRVRDERLLERETRGTADSCRAKTVSEEIC